MKISALSNRRTWIFGGVACTVLIAAASWLLLISPERSSTASIRDQQLSAETQNSVLMQQNAALAKEMQHIARLRAKLRAGIVALPPQSGLPSFTREATRLAKTTGVRLQDITVGTITPLVAPVATTGTDTSTSTDTTTTDTTTTDTTTTDTTTASSLFTIGVTLTSNGDVSHQTTFLKALEHGQRRALVTSTQISVVSKGATSGNTMTTQVTLFSAPLSSAQLATVKSLLGAHT